jgi:hypothetical protein
VATAALVAIAALVSILSAGGGIPKPPTPTRASAPAAAQLFAYTPSRQAADVQRAVAGDIHPLFSLSPGGAIATAARVAAWRGLIDRATAGTGIDPNMLEAIVFLESAGRPDAIAGTDPANAAGLTQIVAETGQALLGMHIDLGQSRRLTAAIATAEAQQHDAQAARLQAQRAKIDNRFDPPLALAASVRYLQLAQRQFGRADLAVESYHMGIGNLEHVLAAYDGGVPVPYAQLYFDSAPDRHAAAYDLLSGFSDDSATYYWRVLGALEIMHLYRTDRATLARLAVLQTASDDAAQVLHPPDRTQSFADPAQLAGAYERRAVVALPSNPTDLGLAYAPDIGQDAKQVGAPTALYRGLRPAALAVLLEIGASVRTLSGGASPLIVAGAVTDGRYQAQLGFSDPEATTGYAFGIEREYVDGRQAAAFQAVLDRLQALNAIAWTRDPATIEVTAASDAAGAIAGGG